VPEGGADAGTADGFAVKGDGFDEVNRETKFAPTWTERRPLK
jgi:hypothetical protein